MSEIDQMFSTMVESREAQMSDINEQASKLKKDPTADFNLAYGDSIKQLSAKDGLGKTFGQPRRLAQERLRSEMTKCE
jgi:golgin subfamily A member 4